MMLSLLELRDFFLFSQAWFQCVNDRIEKNVASLEIKDKKPATQSILKQLRKKEDIHDLLFVKWITRQGRTSLYDPSFSDNVQLGECVRGEKCHLLTLDNALRYALVYDVLPFRDVELLICSLPKGTSFRQKSSSLNMVTVEVTQLIVEGFLDIMKSLPSFQRCPTFIQVDSSTEIPEAKIKKSWCFPRVVCHACKSCINQTSLLQKCSVCEASPREWMDKWMMPPWSQLGTQISKKKEFYNEGTRKEIIQAYSMNKQELNQLEEEETYQWKDQVNDFGEL
jgi:hypothetical protein